MAALLKKWGIVLKLTGELFWNYLGIFAGTRQGDKIDSVG
jgi:hypothetical protein